MPLSWTVATRLNVLVGVILLSGIFGVFGALQIRTGAKLHELNFYHAKYTAEFKDSTLAFEDDKTTLEEVEAALCKVRAQPVAAMAATGVMERCVMTALGTEDAIRLIREDLNLADRTKYHIERYRNGETERGRLCLFLRAAVTGFTDKSAQFEPLVDYTVSTVSNTVIAFVIGKALLVALSGFYLSRSIARDYRRLERTEGALGVANEELKQITCRASHDFKSPLLGIRILAQFVTEDVREGNYDELEEHMDRMGNKVEALQQLVEGTLALARSDLSEPQLDTVELEVLIEAMTDRLDDFAASHGVAISHNIDTAAESFVSDAGKTLTVIENLVTNGVKYSAADRDSFVKIVARRTGPESVQISVLDNGTGIPLERQGEVFDMFTQFHHERSDGTGLGTYLVKKNVDSLGGSIDFESSPEGSRFVIELPDCATQLS